MIIMAAALMLAGADSSADLRHSFVACLKTATSEAKTKKIASDGFVAFARTTCANAEEPFKSVLVKANVSHGMSRKDSASDATTQVDDYYSEWHDNYSAEFGPVPAKPQ